MTVAPLVIAQLGSLGFGDPTFRPELADVVHAQVEAAAPDLVVVCGDLTASGYAWEYDRAAAWIAGFTAPVAVVPGNHDSRNVGYVHFAERFGERCFRRRLRVDPVRAERLRLTGVTVVGLDSSQPDLDEGHVGREWYGWVREAVHRGDGGPDDLVVVALHHHVLPVPGAGREIAVTNDAGDLLAVLTTVGADVVLTGHRHVPAVWSCNGVLVSNCATASTTRLRGHVPPSWTELRVDARTIKVVLHRADGQAALVAIHSRETARLLAESFLVTDEFRRLNAVDAAIWG